MNRNTIFLAAMFSASALCQPVQSPNVVCGYAPMAQDERHDNPFTTLRVDGVDGRPTTYIDSVGNVVLERSTVAFSEAEELVRPRFGGFVRIYAGGREYFLPIYEEAYRPRR